MKKALSYNSKKFKITILSVICGILIVFPDALKAQTDKGSFNLGLRAGDPTGITGKYFVRQNHAIEGIVSFWPYGPAFTGLYEIHASAFSVSGLNWYYGGGVHARYHRSGWYYNNLDWSYPARRYSSGLRLGLDAILGMEYNIIPIPITVGIDLKPTVEFSGYVRLESAVSLRYRF